MKGRIKKTEKDLILLVYDTNFETTEYQISSIEPSLQIEDGDCVLFDIENGFAKISGIQFTGKEMKEEIQNWSNEFDSIIESYKNKNKIQMKKTILQFTEWVVTNQWYMQDSLWYNRQTEGACASSTEELFNYYNETFKK